MSTKFLSPGWRMPRNANQSKQSNYSIDFEGADYIDCGDDNMFSFGNGTTDSPFSVSFWTKLNSVTGTQPFLSKDTTSPNREWAISIFSDTSNGVRIFLKNQGGDTQQSIDSSTALTTGVWYHITTTYDGRGGSNAADGLSIYINGSLDTPTNIAKATYTAMSNTTAPVYIGKYSTNEINGKITEVSIFDYALSASQVTTLWGGGTSVSNPMALPSPPIAYYPLGTSAYNGEYLAENNAIGDYVFDFVGAGTSSSGPHINLGNNSSLSPSSEITVSIWIKTDSNSPLTASGYLDKYSGGGYLLDFGGSSGTNKAGIKFGSSGTRITSTTVVADQKWHNILFTCDNTTLRFYVDGNEEVTASATIADLTSTEDLKIGGDGSSIYFFDGKISNFQIFDSALTEPEVETLYNHGSPIRTLANIPQSSNLQGWWKLDASDTYDSSTGNWTITDHSSNSNNGTSSGMSQASLVQSDLQTVAPYSKYALDFDAASTSYVNVGNNSSINSLNQITGSVWAKFTGTADDVYAVFANWGSTTKFSFEYQKTTSTNSRNIRLRINYGNNTLSSYFITYVDLSDDNWHHLVFTIDGTTNANGINIYVDGAKLSSFTATNTGLYNSSADTLIGSRYTNSTWDMEGPISNVSVWNTDLTSSQVTEIYNQGLPSNLNSHSAYSNLVSWWQLGENSSFDGNDWIVADEKGSNNGTSTGMPVGALVNGVGTTANGVSSGMSEGNLVGDAPYSTANAISSNMVIASRVLDVPPNFDTSSFLYDGIDEYFSGSSVYSSLDGLSNYAVSCWFRSPSYSQTNEMLHTSYNTSPYNQLRIFTRSDRRVFVSHGSNGNYDTYSDNTTLVDNQWYHILCTRDASRGIGDKIRIYINGVNKTENDPSRYANAFLTATEPLFIAKASNSTSNEMEGELDEIAIYNQDMASYVSEIYAGGKVVNLNNLATAPNPISYFRSEKATWDGSNWSMKDINSTYTVTSNNMEQADKTTNVP